MQRLKHIRSLICASVVSAITIGMLTANITETSAMSETESQAAEESLQEQTVPEPEVQEISLPFDSSSTNYTIAEDVTPTDCSDTKNNGNVSESTSIDEENISDLTDTDNSFDAMDTEKESSSDSKDMVEENSSDSTDIVEENPSDSTDIIEENPSDSTDTAKENLADSADQNNITSSDSADKSEESSSDFVDKIEENTSVKNSSSEESSESQKAVRPLEKASASSDCKIYDNHLNTTRILSTFSPSHPFPDDSEKIKYNVSLPLDGIPSFITQEMIVGALKCQDETGFPASVTIAQIIQESGYGSYGEGGEDGQGLSYLAYQYCNLFGIKGEGPAGTVDMRTNEQTFRGTTYTITAGFRVYNTYTECIEDRTKILKESYSDLTRGVKDANTFAMKIGGRWATSRTYAQNLIEQMEHYDLYRLDGMTLEEFTDMIGRFADPCPGSYKTSDFGYRSFDDSFHKGIDLGTGSFNLPTYAAEAGTVIKAGYDSSAGNWIVIDHGDGLITKYMHHKEIYVKEGQHVEKGQQIGLTGSTGYSTGNHLHFQVEENGSAVDPSIYLFE